MRTITFWLFIFAFATFTASPAHGQDAATQQQIDQINGRIENLIDMQTTQGKRLAALEKSISDLQDKLNQPAANSGASADDLKKLAEQVKELAKKQHDDNDLVLKELEKLGKGGGGTASHKPPATTATASPDNSTTNPGDKQNGFWQPVGSGDTIIAIAKAYQDKGIKVTTEQILAANPGLNPGKLKVGQKIWIPKP
jgi:ABC-type transporter Mla subunit MlaD